MPVLMLRTAFMEYKSILKISAVSVLTYAQRGLVGLNSMICAAVPVGTSPISLCVELLINTAFEPAPRPYFPRAATPMILSMLSIS